MTAAREDSERYQRRDSGKKEILTCLREQGFRITKQRELLLDIIFQHECTSCKEIYYQAAVIDPKIGMATVYRMINTLTDLGILQVEAIKPQEMIGPGNGCEIELGSNRKIILSQNEWMDLLKRALHSKGVSISEEILHVKIQ